MGLTVSFDVNYRARLWSQAEAAGTFEPLLPLVDVCVSGEDEAVNILGAETMDEEETARVPAIAASLAKRHGFKTVAMTCVTGRPKRPCPKSRAETVGR